MEFGEHGGKHPLLVGYLLWRLKLPKTPLAATTRQTFISTLDESTRYINETNTFELFGFGGHKS